MNRRAKGPVAAAIVLLVVSACGDSHGVDADSGVVDAGVDARADARTDAPPPSPPRVLEVVAGEQHVCARRASGRVLCWGRNHRGQLGDGTRIDRASPTETAITDAVALSAGASSTCAVHATGALSCWGATNGRSEWLRVQDYLVPTLMPVSEVVDVTGGPDRQNCALSREGRVVCFESPGPYYDEPEFTFDIREVARVPGAVEVTGRGDMGCVRSASGSVECWGASGVTVQIPDIDAVSIADAWGSTCAAVTDGTVWCWRGSDIRRIEGVANAVGVVAVSDSWTPCALRRDAPPVCWSRIDGTAEDLIHLDVLGPSVTLAGVSPNRGFACAANAEGELACYGSNDFGQVGVGDPAVLAEAVLVPGVRDADQLALNNRQSCVRTGGRVACWGGRYDDVVGLYPVEPVEDATSLIAGGPVGGCVLSASEGLACWGEVAFEDAVAYLNTDHLEPIPGGMGLAHVSLSGPMGGPTPWLRAAAVDTEGRVLAADFNVDVRWPSGVETVGFPGEHDEGGMPCALHTDGRVFCLPAARLTLDSPGELDIDGVVSLSVGHAASCMVLETGRVVCLGGDWRGALGLGSVGIGNQRAPYSPVVGLTDAVQVATIAHYGCAVRATGVVTCWGFSEHGASGHLAAGAHPTPRDIIGVSDAVEVAVAPTRACARLRGGEVACWGWDGKGALGLSRTLSYETAQRLEL